MSLPALIPAGDPTLLVNFLAGTLDSRITFARASQATYFDITGTQITVGNNVPRFDYDPITHAPLGLLIEEARTNVLLNSGAPATQTTASLATGTYVLWIVGTGSVTPSGTTATITGAAAATAGSPNTFVVTVAGTVTMTVAGGPTQFQCELGAYATSYIPTTGATATRALETASMPIGPWYNPLAGSASVEWSFEGLTSPFSSACWFVGAAPATDCIGIDSLSAGPVHVGANIITGGVSQISGANYSLPVTPNTTIKTATGWADSGTVNSATGGSAGTVRTCGTLPTVTTLDLFGPAHSQQTLTGHLRALRYWPRRLADPELVAAST